MYELALGNRNFEVMRGLDIPRRRGLRFVSLSAGLVPSTVRRRHRPCIQSSEDVRAVKTSVSVTINGVKHTHEVEPRLLLVHYIRELAGLTGTHVGCDT